jgi:threonine dehydratase
MRGLAEHDHLIVEAAGGAAVAAIQAGRCGGERGPTVAIVSGANVDLDTLVEVLDPERA